MKKKKGKIGLIIIFFVGGVIFIGYSFLKSQLPLLIETQLSDYHQKDGPFYTIYFDSTDHNTVNELIDTTGQILKLAGDWFGKIDSSNSELKIFVIHEKDQPHPSLKDAVGSYLPECDLLFIDSSLEMDLLINIFSHELAHYFTNEYLTNHDKDIYSLPPWFYEGIAEAFASRIKFIPFFSTVTSAGILPLMDISKENATKETYLLSHFAIEDLLSKNGESIITDIIDKTDETNDFPNAFNLLTGYDLDNYHLLFETNYDQVSDIVARFGTPEEHEVEKLIRDFISTKGRYYNEAPSLLYTLSYFYLENERYEEALNTYEEVLVYEEYPEVYSYLSQIALKVDQKKAIQYANQALELAIEKNKNVEVFKQQLENIQNQ